MTIYNSLSACNGVVILTATYVSVIVSVFLPNAASCTNELLRRSSQEEMFEKKFSLVTLSQGTVRQPFSVKHNCGSELLMIMIINGFA